MSHAIAVAGSLTDRTLFAGREVLSGRRHGLRAALPFVGPAVIASIAYMDPGNFATNIQAGAEYGYGLLWVVVVASVVAMMFQALSAKLGIVTGRNLAELCRDHFPRPLVYAMWIASEFAAMATDLAEFLGAAIGLSLMFAISMTAAMAIVGAVTLLILTLQRSGFRTIEVAIGGFVGAIGLCYLAELVIAPPDWGMLVLHTVVPRLGGSDALWLAIGIVGATVMPHAIFLHSGLTQNRIPARNDGERRRLIIFSHREVRLALGLAAIVNMAMVVMAAVAFHDGVHNNVAQIETAYRTLIPLLGGAAAGVFLTSLLASGLSSSVVGTMAGQMIMQGFVGFHIPVWLRRVLTMLPAFVVVALGIDSTNALVASQVALSLVLPVPMVALLVLMARRDVMGDFVNSRLTTIGAAAAAVVILLLNVLLVLQTIGVPLPFSF